MPELTLNQRVPGSSPAAPTTFATSPALAAFFFCRWFLFRPPAGGTVEFVDGVSGDRRIGRHVGLEDRVDGLQRVAGDRRDLGDRAAGARQADDGAAAEVAVLKIARQLGELPELCKEVAGMIFPPCAAALSCEDERRTGGRRPGPPCLRKVC